MISNKSQPVIRCVFPYVLSLQLHVRLTVEAFQSLMEQKGLDRIPPEAPPSTGASGWVPGTAFGIYDVTSWKKCSLSVLANVDLILTYKGNYQVGLCIFCVGKWHLCCLINQIFSGVKENTCLFVSLLLGFVWDVRLLDLVLDMVLFFLR